MNHAAKLCLIVSLAFFPFTIRAQQQRTVSVPQILSETRIDRTVFEYVMTASLTNSAPSLARAVEATVTSTSSNTTIVEGKLIFGHVAGGAVVTTTDTFTIRHDRTVPFNPAVLHWTTLAAPDGPPIKTIALGQYDTLALKTDGSLWTWGYNEYGQLGDGTTVHKLSPVRVGAGNDWAEVAAGLRHTVARKTDGSLWARGWNQNGQLGVDYIRGPIGGTYDWGLPASGGIPTPTPIENSPAPSSLDTDNDGFTDAEELLAGTDPLQLASKPEISSVRAGTDGLNIESSTVHGRIYRLECCEDLTTNQ